ncbi:WD40-repeat-containing domain protein [Podospora didyma]|uniref:Mitochondrial division protein 1 n=1 Tax=Podospora didyma TaxID=330526 RepID=A0AAE0P0C9_9PEZI|nr:WD40-repeat-containing domain protein [Podospora didyma]
MASSSNQNAFQDALEDDSSVISTRGLEAFGRKVTTTASHLIGPLADPSSHPHYQSAMSEVQKQLRRPTLQRSMFSMARTTPTDLVRSRLSSKEIQSRALSYVPEEMLRNIPEEENAFSLFQGFQASFPDFTEDGKKHKRRASRGRKLLEETPTAPDSPHAVHKLKKEKASMMHQLEMLGIRKNLASSEIREIDNKMANLAGMRKIILERLANLEQEEALMEHDVVDVEGRLEDAQELADEAESAAMQTPTKSDDDMVSEREDSQGFMSQSIYEKLPSANSTPTKPKKPRNIRRKSMPILHEHYKPGTMIRSMRAHQDSITAMDFDAPFGMMVSAAMDDSVRVWDLNAGRCIGLLEGHTASVRTLQVEDNFLATGSMDATIKLWDLSKAHYDPQGSQFGKDDEDDGIAFENPNDQPVDPPTDSMSDCPLFTLQAHLDEITALHFRGDVLVSGSADKTLRQWDLEKGRCVQTLDVMWASAQASVLSAGDSTWRQTSRASDASADFVGALQVFDSALACGTADGMVRLWDLRSGQVHRSLVGHTGPVTCLQFDDVHLVTGSLDRSIRIWDLRTGSIYDAYAYDHPITSMMFDTRRIVCAAGEDVVKVYDKVEGRHWDCGAGIAEAEEGKTPAIVERVRIKDGYMVEGRRDGIVAAWTC